jgi:hypothetical protein
MNITSQFCGLAGVVRRGAASSHFSNENPDRPQTVGKEKHKHITDKIPKAVSLLLNDVYDGHLTSLKRKIKGEGW